mmetsp:Transcript_45791/g.106847  ORF Transcript_45791/g.106847 Transcript_45791/m.106847 type:complete len:208 (+) Transcript_45791:661-1284(+)
MPAQVRHHLLGRHRARPGHHRLRARAAGGGRSGREGRRLRCAYVLIEEEVDRRLPRCGRREHLRLRNLIGAVPGVDVHRLHARHRERRMQIVAVALDEVCLIEGHAERESAGAFLPRLVAHHGRKLRYLLALVEGIELRVSLEHGHHLIVDGVGSGVEVLLKQIEHEHFPSREGARNVQIDLVRLGAFGSLRLLLVAIDDGGRERVR